MTKLKSNNMIPLYQQLYDAIAEKIQKGEYKVGERIPSEEQLIELFGISRITVRSGIEKLCEDNILIKKHGKGTYVSSPIHVESMTSGGSFNESCRQIGAVPSTIVISLALEKASPQAKNKLAVNDDKLICIKRLRLVDGVKTIYEVDYLKKEYDFLLNNSLENHSLLRLVEEQTGMIPKRFDNLFDVIFANKDHAEMLDVPIGTALLRVDQTVITADDQIIYCNEQYIRSDRYKYAVRTVK